MSIIDPPKEALVVTLSLVQLYAIMLACAEQSYKMAKRGASLQQVKTIVADGIAATVD